MKEVATNTATVLPRQKPTDNNVRTLVVHLNNATQITGVLGAAPRLLLAEVFVSPFALPPVLVLKDLTDTIAPVSAIEYRLRFVLAIN